MKILDATCGHRAMWFDKHQKDTIYIDIRGEVDPDLIMDCRSTLFPDQYFNLIAFDPPHGSNRVGSKGIFPKLYGCLTADQIRDLISKAFVEFHRILRDDGFVVMKWSTGQFKLKEVLSLIHGFEPLFGQRTVMRLKHPASSYWICFKKEEVRP